MKILREFIREELTWNYWMRRPRNNLIPDVSDELEDRREKSYPSASKDLQGDIHRLKQSLASAIDIDGMMHAIADFGEEAKEMADDPAALSRAIRNNDIEEARRQFISGVERWEIEMEKWSQDSSSDALASEPMKSPSFGGPSISRSPGR